ncbi:Aste57867_776 [Aphanomyces stellatus]|uniref:Aste57867_776 protein n=1 Tax=Aphanomyces stellatus TaxID=120398 RepID=A0A485K3G0_9STRA|nr:hypothetical protein As57867_000775 [Aphanomyces stellatus]VFT78000.1 Aste57867_776 [Aphanomyces stellatus]
MPVAGDADDVDAKRRAEAHRQRKIRLQKKARTEFLEAMVLRLQGELQQLQDEVRSRDTTALLQAIDDAENASLREEVARQSKLADALHKWVVSHLPCPRAMSTQTSWRESTLMADPIARRHGLEWLSQRAYHNAISTFPRHPFGSSVADDVRTVLHTAPDADGDNRLGVTAMEVHAQGTFFANFKAFGRMLWAMLDTHSFTNSLIASSFQVVDKAHDDLVYSCSGDYRTGLRTHRVLAYFDDPTRVVITFSFLAHDECVPIRDSEMRTNGSAWIVLERVTDEITLLRHSVVYLQSVTKHGKSSLHHLGRMFGRNETEILHREAFIQEMRAAADEHYVRGYKTTFQKLQTFLDDELQPFANAA